MATKGQRQLTASQRAELVARAKAGETKKNLAAEYGILERQAYRLIDAAKPPEERREGKGRRGTAPPDARMLRALAAMKEGRPVAALALEVGVDRGTIYRWWRKYGG